MFIEFLLWAGPEPTSGHRVSHLICLASLGSRYFYCPHSIKIGELGLREVNAQVSDS